MSSAPPDMTCSSLPDGNDGRSASAALRMARRVSSSSSPNLHSAMICASPLEVVEVTLVTPGTASSACSTGSVTVLAISSGARPCDCAMTNAMGTCIEGISSCFSDPIETTPITAIARVVRPTMSRFLRLVRVRNDMNAFGWASGGATAAGAPGDASAAVRPVRRDGRRSRARAGRRDRPSQLVGSGERGHRPAVPFRIIPRDDSGKPEGPLQAAAGPASGTPEARYRT